MAQTTKTKAHKEHLHGDLAIQDVAAWVLRIGVVSSVAVMLIGLVVSFFHRSISVDYMQSARFNLSGRALWQGLRDGRGQSIMELGILMLVLTPIMRVATSMLLFLFEEHDWFYTLVTFLVLVLTLVALLVLQ